jgi:hypothetical protein
MLGGIGAVVFVWILTVGIVFLRPAQHGGAGLSSVVGGWDMLLRSPVIVVLLAAGFGVGFRMATCIGTT